MLEKSDKKILCVDDAPIILNALKRELELEGYGQVYTAAGGDEALALARDYKFDVYIVDQTMPGMTGTEFVTRLNQVHKNPLVFILTGHDQGGQALQLCRKPSEEAGFAVHYFTKPWDTSFFIELQRALETHTQQLELEKKLKNSEVLANVGLSTRKLAHEIRSPLGIISGAAQLLENNIDRFESSNQTCTEIIIKEVNRLANLLDDLSAFSKSNQLKLELHNVNRILSDVLELLRIEGKNKNIHIEATMDPALPDMLVDSRKLYQTFLNIGKNAIEAMSENGSLTVTTSYESGPEKINICIADTGAGIPKELQEKIFNLFFTTKGDKGSGIGLSIAKQFITAHGGEIWLESEPGRGTTFHITLDAKMQ